MTSLLDQPGRPARSLATLAHIGPNTLALVGAREFAHSDERGLVTFQVDGAGGRMVCRMNVQLGGADEYEVESGYIDPSTWQWTVHERAESINVGQLSETVERLADRMWDL